MGLVVFRVLGMGIEIRFRCLCSTALRLPAVRSRHLGSL